MKTAYLIWSMLAALLIPQVVPTDINFGAPAYTLTVSPQPRKISVFRDNFIGISGCQVAVSSVGSPGAKTLNKLAGTFDSDCDIYLVSEIIESTSSFLAIDGKGTLSVFQMASNMQSYVRTSYIKLPYTAYYYPRVYKAELVPDTSYVFIGALQTNILFRVLVEPGGTATAVKYLTNALSQSYETMAATKNNRLVLMSASGQYMELWDTTTMSFITGLEFSPFVFGNIYRSVAYYPIVSQQDFIMAPKTGLVAHFIDLTNRFIVSEFTIKQDNPEFCIYVPRTNYFAVVDPTNIDFLNVLDPTMSKTFLINTGLSMDTIGVSFFAKSGTGYMILTYSPGGSFNGRVFDLGTHLCHVTCATCSASLDPSRCDACQIGHSKTPEGLCEPTYLGQLFRESTNMVAPSECYYYEYKTTYASCKDCGKDCRYCDDYTGFCSDCRRGVAAIDGKCVSSCPPGTARSYDRCKHCYPTCKTCSYPGSYDSCTTCHTGMVLDTEYSECVPEQSSVGGRFDRIKRQWKVCSKEPVDPRCLDCTFAQLEYAGIICGRPLYMHRGFCKYDCDIEENVCRACDEVRYRPFGGGCLDSRLELPHTKEIDYCMNFTVISETQQSTSSPSSSPTLAIVLSSIGCFLLIGCIVSWTCYLRKRRLEEQRALALMTARPGGTTRIELAQARPQQTGENAQARPQQTAENAQAPLQQTAENTGPIVIDQVCMLLLPQERPNLCPPDQKLRGMFCIPGIQVDNPLPVSLEKETFVLAVARPKRLQLNPALILPELHIIPKVNDQQA